MHVRDLIADLSLYPDDYLVIFETVERVSVVTAVSSAPTHADDTLTTIARHFIVDCHACGDHVPLVSAVCLLGLEISEKGRRR